MELSDGWVPSYNDPDNAGLAPEAEPYCPKCDELERENMRNYVPMSLSATVMPLFLPNDPSQTTQPQSPEHQ